jgi:hypothetical protein
MMRPAGRDRGAVHPSAAQARWPARSGNRAGDTSISVSVRYWTAFMRRRAHRRRDRRLAQALCVLLLWPAPAAAQSVVIGRVPDPSGTAISAVQQRPDESGFTVERPRIRGGVGVDLLVQDGARLHLDLVPARDPAVRGWRWKQRLGDGARTAGWWSLGAGFDVVRTASAGPLDPLRERHPYRDRRIVLSPQLLVDLDRVAGLDGCAELRLQHAYWRGSGDLADRDRAMQIELRWRF